LALTCHGLLANPCLSWHHFHFVLVRDETTFDGKFLAVDGRSLFETTEPRTSSGGTRLP